MKRTSLFLLTLFAGYSSFSHSGPTRQTSLVLKQGTHVAIPVTAKTGLMFIENKGQVTDQYNVPRSDIRYMVQANNGLSVFLSPGAVHYQFRKEVKAASTAFVNSTANHFNPTAQSSGQMDMYRMDIQLVGANKNARIVAEQPQPYYEHYFAPHFGPEGATAHSFSRITYKDVYPHIDWVLYTTGSALEYEFVVRPGGKVSDIKLSYEGCQNIHLDNSDQLVAEGPQGTITEHAPFSYQSGGQKISSHFVLAGNTLSYAVDKYRGKLVIDPAVEWATYYGGTSDESCSAVATDAAGNVYMAGGAGSASAIATTGAYQTVYGGGGSDCFIACFNGSGTRLWATYFGATGDESFENMALDNRGNIYASGYTINSNGLASAGAYQSTPGGNYDGILAKFSTAGVEKWATYYGGGGKDFAYGVATDAAGNVYMGGQTRSTSGIASAGAYQTVIGDTTGTTGDAMLVKFDSAGTRLWGTYYGGDDYDYGHAVAVDASGNVYIAGQTASMAGIASAGAYQPAHAGGDLDAFLAKFNSTGALQWGTYYGGFSTDDITALTTDRFGAIYVAGQTASTNNIAPLSGYQNSFGGGSSDGFLVKFNNSGNRIWGTFFGDAGDDYINSIAVDDTGNVYFAGLTNSGDNIPNGAAIQNVYGGGIDDACSGKYDSSGILIWSTYYGGGGNDQAYGVALDAAGNIYIGGQTTSPSGVATSGAFQSTFGGGAALGDAFLMKINKSNVGIAPNLAKATSVNIYPNPAKEAINIDAPSAGSIDIYTVDGIEVYTRKLEKGKTSITLPANLSAGTYLCRFTGRNGYTETIRLIHEK